MICPRYGSSIGGPKCFLATAKVFVSYTYSEPCFNGLLSSCYFLQQVGRLTAEMLIVRC